MYVYTLSWIFNYFVLIDACSQSKKLNTVLYIYKKARIYIHIHMYICMQIYTKHVYICCKVLLIHISMHIFLYTHSYICKYPLTIWHLNVYMLYLLLLHVYAFWICVLLQNALSFLQILMYIQTHAWRSNPHGRQSRFIQTCTYKL